MGEQRALFEQQMAAMKAQMEDQMSRMTQALESVRIDADNARKNAAQLKQELVEVKRREWSARLEAESKAREKQWFPVTRDEGAAT
eukprot:7990149-Alexandrium_andersonii.AAC.1